MIYKEHKIIIFIIAIIAIIATALLLHHFNMQIDNTIIHNYASNIITFCSITVGFYIAGISSLLSSKYVEKLNTKDPFIKTQRKIHTVIYYFKYAIYLSLLTIILAFILIFNSIFSKFIIIILLSFTTTMIIINILFVILILKLLSDALIIQSRKE
ncbi:MAG: hypothetical protein IJV35_07360 [Neisseriaceae bacterium]|nr:hypothetical protein [Neisseriaceae bacterium]